MSFYTCLKFYRPTTPPKIIGQALARFVRSFQALGVSAPQGALAVEVKFGRAIDQDENPAYWLEPISDLISVDKEINWDVETQCQSPTDMIQLLGSHKRSIYRAYLDLGPAADQVVNRLARTNSPENEVDLCPDKWRLEIGPIQSGSLDGDTAFLVGWISVGLSGPGYLYPWTFHDLVQRAELQPAIQRLMQLCRATWPVPHGIPNPRIRKLRKQMGGLWPYSRFDLPWDWYWGLQESG